MNARVAVVVLRWRSVFVGPLENRERRFDSIRFVRRRDDRWSAVMPAAYFLIDCTRTKNNDVREKFRRI